MTPGRLRQAELTDGFQSGAVLPNNAVDSGYRRDNLAIWHIPGDESFIWVVSPDTVERWPAGPTPVCTQRVSTPHPALQQSGRSAAVALNALGPGAPKR